MFVQIKRDHKNRYRGLQFFYIIALTIHSSLSSIAFNFRRHEEFKRSIKRGTLKRLSLKSYLQLRLVKELRMSMLLLVLALTHCALTVPANIALLLQEIWPDFWSHLRGKHSLALTKDPIFIFSLFILKIAKAFRRNARIL